MASIPNAGAADALGDIALGQGRRDAAERDYRQAIALDEFDPHGHFGLAGILDAEGKIPEATAEYHAVLGVDPRNPEANEALKRMSSKSNDANKLKP